jgi:hypothetical protein
MGSSVDINNSLIIFQYEVTEDFELVKNLRGFPTNLDTS